MLTFPTIVHCSINNCVARNIVAPVKRTLYSVCLPLLKMEKEPIWVEAKVEPNVMDARQEEECGPVSISGCFFSWDHAMHPILEDGGNVLEKCKERWIVDGIRQYLNRLARSGGWRGSPRWRGWRRWWGCGWRGPRSCPRPATSLCPDPSFM